MDITSIGQDIIKKESSALLDLANSLSTDFENAVKLILETPGYVVITGMGKSGHIANKIAATFSSTGTPSFFIHPAEASHGDLGMITQSNTVIAISNSGESKELFDILEYCKRNGIKLIGITAKGDSTLGKYSDIKLVLPFTEEACYLNLAPTNSTTMSLALGDALAVAVYSLKNFSKIDFGNFHPGGKLGKQLLKIKDVYRNKNEVATIKSGESVSSAVEAMSSNLGGCVSILSNDDTLIGILTDGDIRRHLLNSKKELVDMNNKIIDDIMTVNPYSITVDTLAVDAMHIMNTKRITALPVLDNGIFLGLVHIHDLLRLGF